MDLLVLCFSCFFSCAGRCQLLVVHVAFFHCWSEALDSFDQDFWHFFTQEVTHAIGPSAGLFSGALCFDLIVFLVELVHFDTAHHVCAIV